ncbi:MAG: NirA family protein [Verrucomicrobia bacterium]|nr:NirA family protein [Verrucomicrobiota bacterium]
MLTEISGQKLTTEQTAYLDGLFAGLRNRGLTFSDVEPNPAAVLRTPPTEDLIPEERIKRELHPLDTYPSLLQHAASNQAPDRENTFRFKWHGLFFLTPNREAYMARLRIPGGRLHSFQLRELANIAEALTTGYIQITTRANLQIRLIQPKDTVEFVRRIQGIGLHTRGAGADNIRNLTCDPTSGVDPNELIETLPLVESLGQLILNHREFYDLPRKFNIAFHGGGSIPTVEDTNDIGFKAVRVEASTPPVGLMSTHGVLVTEEIASGVYFRCSLGGATGHKAFARDLGVLIRPEEILEVTSALLRVYITNGNRNDRKRARLKHLLESWSLERYLVATETLLGRPLLRIPAGATWVAPTVTPRPHPQVGVCPQKQSGFHWIGANVPVGQMTSRQLRRLAEIADLYGSGQVRLTVWQNFVLTDVPDAFVETAKKALARIGFGWRQSNVGSGVIACTGNSYCKFASADTKGHALDLIRWLERRLELDQPINIHLTGCPNSCAQHYMGDLGLLGTKVKVGGESVPGYHVFVGGGFGDRQAVGRQLFTGVSATQLNTTVERILKNFLRHRTPGEAFQTFTARHDLRQLQELLGDET